LRISIFFFLIVGLFQIGCKSDSKVENQKIPEKIDESIQEAKSTKVSIVSLEFGDLKIQVEPSIGGRLASLEYQGTQMIETERDAEHLHWGSTAWPSPQSQWDWPSPTKMDQGNYEVKISEPTMLLLESEPNAYLGLTIKKRYHLRDPRTMDITYQFFNEKDTTIKVGIWENTRVDYSGQISWATDKDLKASISNMSEVADETRLVLQGQNEKEKLFINSDQGWVAYKKDDVELKKTFPIVDQKSIAKNQAQIEINIDPKNGFAEIAEHGPYEELGPGGVATFRIRWNLKTLQK